MKSLMEKRIEQNLETRVCIIVEVLKDAVVSSKVRRVLKNIHKETNIKVRIGNELSNHATISRGVRQGCPQSHVLFKMRIYRLIKEWQKTESKDIRIDK